MWFYLVKFEFIMVLSTFMLLLIADYNDIDVAGRSRQEKI